MPSAPKSRQLKHRVNRTDQRRVSASEAGYDWHWTSVVAPQIRQRDEFMCQRCLREGGLAEAIAEMLSRPQNKDGSVRQPPVGHIKPGNLCTQAEFYDPANLETICERHNALQAAEDANRYGSARR